MNTDSPYISSFDRKFQVEYLGGSVQVMYIALFGRPADIPTISYWMHQSVFLDRSIAPLGNAIAVSAEFRALYPTSATAAKQIDAIYLNVYGRHATASEVRTFAPLLKTAAQPHGTQTLPELADMIMLAPSSQEDMLGWTCKRQAANMLTLALDTDGALGSVASNAYAGGVIKAWLAQVVDTGSMQLAEGRINTMLHDLAFSVNPASVPPSDLAGSGTMTITVPLPHAGVLDYSTLTDAHAGEKIIFSGTAASTFVAAPLVLPAGATFHNYLDGVAAGAGTTEGWFQYDNNTYLVSTQPTAKGAHKGFVDGTDSVVKLAGLIDLSHATFSSSGLLINTNHGGDGVLNVALQADFNLTASLISVPLALPAGATLDDYLSAAVAAANAAGGEAIGEGDFEEWFQFGGDTYVVEIRHVNGFVQEFDPTFDTVMKMTGLYELTGVTLARNSNNSQKHGMQFTMQPGDSGAIMVTIPAPGATADRFVTVADVHAGETIALGATAAAHFTSAALKLPAASVFHDYLDGVAAGAGSQEGWFQFGGDTYLVATAAAAGTARTSFIDGTDFVVKLPGLVDLSGALLGKNGLLLNSDHAASRAMTITVPLNNNDVATPAITDAHHGETIGFETSVPAHFTAAQLVLASSTFKSYQDAAVTGVGAQEGWFQYHGNTYLVASQTAAGVRHTGFDQATDFIVELPGLFDLSGAVPGANGLTLANDRLDAVYVDLPSYNLNAFLTITAAHAGQLIVFGSAGAPLHFEPAALKLAAGAGLHAYLDAAAAGAGNQEKWFQFQGDTYLVATQAQNAVHTGFVNGSDFFVKLTGLVDLSHATLGTMGLTLH